MIMLEFEDILARIGKFGPFQIRLYILVSMFETPGNWGLLLPIFGSAMPDFRCLVIGGTENSQSPEAIFRNVTSYRNKSEGACVAGDEVCPGIEYTSAFTSVISEWDLLCNKEYVSSLITSIQMVGLFFGATMFGQLGDTFGRKRMLYLNYTLFLLFHFLSAFANSWQLYSVCRFFVGVFYAGTILLNSILPMEYVGSKWRTLCGTLGCFTFGSMTLAGLAYLIRDWRHLTIATSCGGVFILLSWWFVPESPRWLIKKGRIDEAKAILLRVAKCNGRPTPDLSDLSAINENDKSSQSQKVYTYLDLFRNWRMTKYALVSMFCMFTVSVAYYGITFNLSNLSGNMYLNVFLAASLEIGPTIFVIAFSNRLGRKRTSILLLCTGGFACLGIIALDFAGKMESMTWLTNAFAFFGKLGAGGAWDSLLMMSVELFPTVVRNMGVGLCSVAARVGGVLAPQLVYMVKYYKATPYLVAGILSVTTSILLLLVPETANKPLWEEMPPRTFHCCCESREEVVKPPCEAKINAQLQLTAEEEV